MNADVGPARRQSVTVQPIHEADVADVAAFLHLNLNARVPVAAWERLLRPGWAEEGDDRGFQLRADDGIVGAYVAVRAPREIAGVRTTVCNLAALCVLPEFRMHSLKLIRAILAQKDAVFTDLSPSGAVPAMNERLGFRHLDVSTRLLVNVPIVRRRGLMVSDDPARLSGILVGEDAIAYRDHRDAAAAHHLVAYSSSGDYAYLVYRRDRRKRLPLFATPLYAGGDIELLRRAWPVVAAHLLRRGLPFTLAESRVLGFTPSGAGVDVAHPRPRMHKGGPVPQDYLYSESALLRW